MKRVVALQRGQSASAAPDIFDKFMVVTLVIFYQLLAAKKRNRPKKELIHGLLIDLILSVFILYLAIAHWTVFLFE